MRVLHVIPSIDIFTGGPAHAILPMCSALAARGIQVTLATTATRPLAATFADVIDYRGVKVNTFSSIDSTFKYSRRLSKWLNANIAGFDLTHIHGVFNHSSISAALACRRNNVPYIVRPLGTLVHQAMKRKPMRKRLFLGLLARELLEQAAAIHYTSSLEKDSVEASVLKSRRGFVVPLGVEMPNTSGQISDRTLGGSPYILFLSRIVPSKGVDALIEAFLRLKQNERFADWRLLIAGDGPDDYVEKLRAACSTEVGRSSILFPGWLSGNEKSAVLGHASLLVLPSQYESFGLSVVEAMAFGVPPLVSPCVPISAELVSAEAGWVADVDANSLEGQLALAMSSSKEREKRGRNARRVAGRYAWEIIAEKLEYIYDDAVRTTHNL